MNFRTEAAPASAATGVVIGGVPQLASPALAVRLAA
jgi:hypothetical protein